MSPSSANSRLAVGDIAPDFTLFSDEEDPWQLSNHRGTPVVLLFFPGAFTSVCTTELNTVNNNLDAFGEAHVVGLSTDSPFVLSEFRSAEQLDFPLLSDHDADVCVLYGAKYAQNFGPMELDRISKRAAFLIDQDGVIRYAEVLENAGRQPDLDSIIQTLHQLES